MPLKEPVRVLITGAAGQIGYALIPLFANGLVFGLDQPMILHLLEIPQAENALKGVCMEIDDGSYPLVYGLVPTTNHEVAFKDIDFAVMVGGFPRKKGMERKDLLQKNKAIFEEAGKSLDKYAKKTVKTLVVANPANTNCLMMLSGAPSIPKENFCALTRLDMNRGIGQLANRLKATPGQIKNFIVWGNHSSTQVPDPSYCKLVSSDGKEESDVVAKINDNEWLQGEFETTVRKRGGAIIAARGLSSAMSAANATKDCLRDWVLGTKEGCHVAMSVYSDGKAYGIAPGIMYSFPCTCKDGKWTIVPDLKCDDRTTKLMKASEEELLAERKDAGLPDSKL